MSAALLTRLKEEYGTVQDTLPANVISTARRREAIDALCARGLPVSRDENWRYTNLRVLERARFVPVPTPAETLPNLPEPPAGFIRYVFVDGRVHSGAQAPQGITVRTPQSSEAIATGEAADWRLSGELPEARLALLNEAFATDAISIDVRAGAQATGIELVFVAAADARSGASYPRVRLALEAGAQLTVVERHIGSEDAASLVNSAVCVELAPNAQLTHYRLQQCGTRTAWFDTLDAELSADSRYELLALSTGALAARSSVHTRLAGAGAEVALAAASLGDGRRSQDMYALSEHLAPRTRTVETFRGIASERSRVAFIGKIAVREHARGTDSRQSLRGLLDGPEAEIDVRPQLEIYTDEVSCSHGATAGKLDENMLFYLLSRGLARDAAHDLLRWAFLEDVVAKIALPDLRRQIELGLVGQLSEMMTLKELL